MGSVEADRIASSTLEQNKAASVRVIFPFYYSCPVKPILYTHPPRTQTSPPHFPQGVYILEPLLLDLSLRSRECSSRVRVDEAAAGLTILQGSGLSTADADLAAAAVSGRGPSRAAR